MNYLSKKQLPCQHSLKLTVNIFLAFFFIKASCFSQNYIFGYDSLPVVVKNNKQYKYPWVGGLNAVSVNKMDLNNDGNDDLVLYEKTTGKLSTFLSINAEFIYKPEYELFFPKIENWLVLEDYNGDGKKDIFTGSNSTTNIVVYKNTYTSYLTFTLASSALKYSNINNSINSIDQYDSDLPAISDIDGDGDVDILSYDNLNGSGVRFFINKSIETYGNSDSLLFEKYTSCWGRFQVAHECSALINFPTQCQGAGGTHDFGRQMHTGSVITILDLNKDGLKDLLLSYVECDGIHALTNTGTNVLGRISASKPNFPDSYPVNMVFPATFYHDVTHDSIKDLIVSPNSLDVEDTSSVWLYKNTGSDSLPEFEFQKKNFIQDEMIDLGGPIIPSLTDLDADHDLDLFVSVNGKKTGLTSISSIYVYKNIGTRDNAIFELRDTNFLDLRSLQMTFIKSGFADINNDGAVDIYFLNRNSSYQVSVNYLLNKNGSAEPLKFNINELKSLNISTEYFETLSIYDNPFLANLDSDTEMEILLGRDSGKLQLFDNTGTSTIPSYTKISDTLLGINTETGKESIFPFFTSLHNKDTLDLLTIENSGELKVFPSVKQSLTSGLPISNLIYNSVNSYTYSSDFGNSLSIAAGDLDNNGTKEIIIGTGGGGLIFLKNLRKAGKIPILPPRPPAPVAINKETKVVGDNYFKVYPNPAHNQSIEIIGLINAQVCIYNSIGKPVITEINLLKNNSISISPEKLSPGIYFFKFQSTSGISIKRVVVL